MTTLEAVITVKRSAGVQAAMLWASLAEATEFPQPIALDLQGKGLLLLSAATDYVLFYQFHGGPGQTLSVEIAVGETKLLEIKESKVPPGKDFQAGARPFKT